MGTPDDVIRAIRTLYADLFSGNAVFMLYNYGAAILRAIGDTKRPLIFLIFSGIVNACLNSAAGDCFSSGCGRGGDRNRCISVPFQYSGFMVSDQVGRRLLPSDFKT